MFTKCLPNFTKFVPNLLLTQFGHNIKLFQFTRFFSAKSASTNIYDWQKNGFSNSESWCLLFFVSPKTLPDGET